VRAREDAARSPQNVDACGSGRRVFAAVKSPGQVPTAATRSFQALRIDLDNEYGELFNGVDGGGKRALKARRPAGCVTFHSVEDSMANAFLTGPRRGRGKMQRFCARNRRARATV